MKIELPIRENDTSAVKSHKQYTGFPVPEEFSSSGNAEWSRSSGDLDYATESNIISYYLFSVPNVEEVLIRQESEKHCSVWTIVRTKDSDTRMAIYEKEKKIHEFFNPHDLSKFIDFHILDLSQREFFTPENAISIRKNAS